MTGRVIVLALVFAVLIVVGLAVAAVVASAAPTKRCNPQGACVDTLNGPYVVVRR